MASGRRGQSAEDSGSTKSSQLSFMGRWKACGTMIFAAVFSSATLSKYRAYSWSRWALREPGEWPLWPTSALGAGGCCKQSREHA